MSLTMTSPDDALPASFMGATLQGGQLNDLKAYLQAIESKQKELLLKEQEGDDDLGIKLKECNRLIIGIQKMMEDKQKFEQLDWVSKLIDPNKERCVEIAGDERGTTRRRRQRRDPSAVASSDDDMPPLEDYDREERITTQRNERILSAAMRNDVREIRYLVEIMDANPRYANQVKQTPLHIAAIWGSVEALKQLLRFKADCNAQNTISGATLLHSLMMSKNGTIPRRLQCLNLLLEYGADPNLKDRYGRLPADYWSGETKSRCLVTKLLPHQPALFEAIEQGDDTAVEGMLNVRWVKISNLQSAVGKTLNGKIGIVLTRNVNQDGRHQVQVRGIEQINLIKPDNLKPCDDEKISVLSERYLGQSPLLYNVNLFLEERNNPTDPELMAGLIRSLKILSQEGMDSNVDASTLLVEKNGDDNHIQDDQNDEPSIFTRLCREIQDAYYEDSAVCSSEENDMEIRILIEVYRLLVPFQGKWTEMTTADKDKIVRMFHTACRKNNLGLARFFVEVVRLEPNVQGQGGMTALHFAARSGCVEMVQFLLQTCKVDGTTTNTMGKTPLDMAMVNQKQDVTAVLKKYMTKNGT